MPIWPAKGNLLALMLAHPWRRSATVKPLSAHSIVKFSRRRERNSDPQRQDQNEQERNPPTNHDDRPQTVRLTLVAGHLLEETERHPERPPARPENHAQCHEVQPAHGENRIMGFTAQRHQYGKRSANQCNPTAHRHSPAIVNQPIVYPALDGLFIDLLAMSLGIVSGFMGLAAWIRARESGTHSMLLCADCIPANLRCWRAFLHC